MAVASEQKGKSQREGGPRNGGLAPVRLLKSDSHLEPGWRLAEKRLRRVSRKTGNWPPPNPTVRVPGPDCWASDSRAGTFLDVQLWAQP